MSASFRQGAPRPLSAHIAAGAADLQNGAALAARLDDPRFPWRPGLREEARKLAETVDAQAEDGLTRDALAGAVAREGLRSFRAALEGVARYQQAPPLRRPADPPAAWSLGAARLLDFGADDPALASAPVLVALPSLVNSPKILDLTRARSLMRGLAARGVRPMLLSWGDPGPEERRFDLGALLAKRVEPALQAAAEIAGGKVALLGHCMSGALAAASAQAWPDRIRKLTLLASPWDFGPLTPPPAMRPRRSEVERLIDACGAIFGGVPTDLLNTLFFLRDPLQATRKFPSFASLSRSGPRGRLFVAVEDWLNDGVRLPAPAARELFLEWGLDNSLGRGHWAPLGAPVRPQAIAQPTLLVAAPSDTVTPEDSAAAPLAGLANAMRITPSGGHVGMIVGRRAEAELWDPLADWVRS